MDRDNAELILKGPVQRTFGAPVDCEPGEGVKRQERGQQAHWFAVDHSDAFETEDTAFPTAERVRHLGRGAYGLMPQNFDRDVESPCAHAVAER